MADRVLSWQDFGNRLTKKSGHTNNQCPSYADIKSSNIDSVCNSVIDWPPDRSYSSLILNKHLKDDVLYYCKIIGYLRSNGTIQLTVQAYKLINGQKNPVKIVGSGIVISSNGTQTSIPNYYLVSSIDKSDEYGNHNLNIPVQSDASEIQISVWIDGHRRNSDYLVIKNTPSTTTYKLRLRVINSTTRDQSIMAGVITSSIIIAPNDYWEILVNQSTNFDVVVYDSSVTLTTDINSSSIATVITGSQQDPYPRVRIQYSRPEDMNCTITIS